jgi:hypothetical protein
MNKKDQIDLKEVMLNAALRMTAMDPSISMEDARARIQEKTGFPATLCNFSVSVVGIDTKSFLIPDLKAKYTVPIAKFDAVTVNDVSPPVATYLAVFKDELSIAPALLVKLS